MKIIQRTWVLITLLFLIGQSAYSQINHYTHHFDLKTFNLGFMMGMNYNTYNLKEGINITEDNITLKRIELMPKPGFVVGMIGEAKLHDNITVRFNPHVSLEQRDFNFVFVDKDPQIRKVEAAYFNMPLLFKFRSDFYSVYRLYLITGPQLGLNLGSNKKVRDNPNLLKIQSQDVSFVIGAGFNVYGDRIRIAPEIRYSAGIGNIFVPEYTTHAGGIQELYSQVLSIIINFQ